MNNWFEVSKEGLKQLQAGKGKTFIINELIQNAFDEDIKKCKVDLSWSSAGKEIRLEVEDDSPEGFKDITHAYTLYADTYKRRDPTKRGRFNLGEKQVIAICNSAKVETTKGTVIFDNRGRQKLDDKTKQGSKVTIWFDATIDDYNELMNHIKKLIVPKHIKLIFNDKEIKSKQKSKSFKVRLTTDVLENDILKIKSRETYIDLYESDGQSWIYEMGIPIMKTDCSWHIDVQQKVQLNVNRDNILPSYVQDLYAEVLNNTYQDIEDASALWVRTAMKDKRATPESISGVMTKRFGEKYCVANPNDKASMDDAISRGYNVIYGSEMSKDEWSNAKAKINIESTSSLFGHNALEIAKPVVPTNCMTQTASYTKRIALRILSIKVDVKFVNAPNASVLADYNSSTKTLRFNIGRLPKNFFDNPVSEKTTDLIIHELGHENGWHIEKGYHELITEIGAKLTMLALKEPKFFEVN